MAETDWTTTSVKLSRDMKLKLEKYCEMEKTTPNKFLRGIIEKKLAFMTDSSKLRENKGIPIVGQHTFPYNLKTDKFTWEIKIGDDKKAVISEEMPAIFVQGLKSALDLALKEREQVQEKLGLNKDKVIVPRDIMRFGVKKE